ncbi:MAG: hypothetical protein ACPLRY_03230 [Candidatus Bathyarchaeales archaeon]
MLVASLILIVGICFIAIIYINLSTPQVLITYHGENTVPEGLVGFPDTSYPFFYSWNITLININPLSGMGVPAERALQPLVSKYPQLVTMNITIPGQGISNTLTLRFDVTGLSGDMKKQCFVLYAKSQLNSDQINSLTEDLETYLTPALLEWYS